MDLLGMLSDYRRKELCKLIDLTQEELDNWQEITRKMRVCFHDDGIISQFEGYEELEELDWDDYRAKYGDIHRLDRILEAEGDTPNRYKLSKQADVLMLFYLFSSDAIKKLLEGLGYDFDVSQILKNIDYYMARTAHGSTLSRIVHSWVLARSDRIRSWSFFTEALESDISDSQGGTTKEGIHLGAMAGSVDLIQRGYTGIEMHNDVLWFDPCLPDEIRQLYLRIRYRDHLLMLTMNHEKLKVASVKVKVKPIKIGVKDDVRQIGGGETQEFVLSPVD
jgi:alpha,alpha-trehalase